MADVMILTALQGDKLDLLLWREAGLGPADLTRVLDANPGLADLGPVLPLGTRVTIPADLITTAAGAQSSGRTIPTVNLWD